MTEKWRLEVEHAMGCNCNWGCPCSFEAPPTYGPCEAALAWHIVEGVYGQTRLDGLNWALAAAWPGPLHERGGRGVIFIDDTADSEQREALEAIATGRAGGPIATFMSTVTSGTEVRYAKVDVKVKGKETMFGVEGNVGVQFEAIRNPVSGAEHSVAIELPGGMLNKREDAFSVRWLNVDAGGLRFSHSGRNALSSRAIWEGP